jgi:hypothetical protein
MTNYASLVGEDSTTLGGVAGILIASAVVVAAAALLVLIVVGRFGGGRLSVGPVKIELDTIRSEIREVREGVDEIGTAVNHSAPGVPTLVKRVETIEGKIDGIDQTQRYLLLGVRLTAAHVGARLPDDHMISGRNRRLEDISDQGASGRA